MNAIEIRNLNKSFKGFKALDNLNLTVPVGLIYWFIGENGSGKSTLMKIICDHLVKDSRTIKLFEKEYKDNSIRCRIAVLIENTGCFPKSTVYANIFL